MRNQHRWTKLRCNGQSPHDAFEELCSQIARNLPPPAADRFVRNGTPDGGIEYYWLLRNKKIVGWQCKFFEGQLTPGQWADLDQSFKDALDNYPELTGYVVALPQDLAQGRGTGKKTFRQKWEERVKKWESIACVKKRKIKIEYFGDSEIFNFLDVQDQAGRRWYWFEDTALTQDWFERRMKSSIANAGARYTPKLNIEVPLRKTLEFLGRTEYYRNLLLNHRGSIRKASRYTLSNYPSKIISKTKLSEGARMLRSLDVLLTRASDRQMCDVDWPGIRGSCRSLIDLLREIYSAVGKAKEAKPAPHTSSPVETLGMKLNDLDRLTAVVYGLMGDLDQCSADVTNKKSLLLTGNAGAGKTHILCDFASGQVSNRVPAILLFGEHFNDGEPWSQICHHLQLGDLGCDKLLQALESAAQARQERALIVIDGLNEGQGRTLWKKFLPGMLVTLADYKWIGLIISLRSGYESCIADDGNVENLQMLMKEHRGFADIEFDAIPDFCKYYGLSMPSMPVLLPEYQNPLFLKLTCESLQFSTQKKLNLGVVGVNATFDSFITAVNRKLSERLGFDPKENLVQQALELLTKKMAELQAVTLQYATAKDIVNQVLSSQSFEASLFKNLISEGVLTETIRYRKDRTVEDHVRFSYERHSDHMIARHLLSTINTVAELKEQFQSDRPLGEICSRYHIYRGVIEALSIQVPERYGEELQSLIPAEMDEFRYAQILLSGLIWRDPRSIGNSCINFLLKWTNKNEMFANSFLDTLVALSAIPAHPLNADLLNDLLVKFSMPKRDFLWSRFVSEYANYGNETAVGRLIGWLSSHDAEDVSDISAYLYSTTLIWMLCSPNRVLRDRATKGLIRLMGKRIVLLVSLLKQFSEINDAYISERLYGVAYGCALRAMYATGLKELAEFVFERQFKAGSPDANILLRDHARGIIEICASKIEIPAEWIAKSRPPYNDAQLPDFPTQEGVDKYKGDGPFNEDTAPYSRLYYMVMGDDDFSRDLFQSNLAARWLSKDSRDARLKQVNANRWNRIGEIDWRGPQRWALQRAIELGWKRKLFADFDDDQFRRGRSRDDHRFEGFDKKYAWIALYEILAHLQDSADFNDEDSDDLGVSYRGPWQLSYIRNIDVSRLEPIRGKQVPEYINTLPLPPLYNNWQRPKSEVDWVKQRADLPNPIELIAFQDWILLSGSFDWEEPTEPGEDKYDIPRRSLWFSVQSHLVVADDAGDVADWLKNQDLFNRALPAPPYSHNIFLGEFFRGLAFKDQNCAFHCRDGWTRDYGDRIPGPVLVTADGYLNESGVLDSSFERSVNFKLPCEFLVNELELEWNGEAGFEDRKGELIAFDPMYWNRGPSRLLINRSKLLAFLKRKKLEIIWTIQGRKAVLGERWGKDAFSGQLEMQGVCCSKNGQLRGNLNFLLINKDRKKIKLRAREL